MGRGSSKLGGGGGAAAKVSGTVGDITKAFNSGDTMKAGDIANNSIENAGYFMLENNGNVTIYGKNANNSFTDLAKADQPIRSRDIDADEMARLVATTSGTWSAHKYDGQVQFPASALPRSKHPGIGFMNAIILAKKPSNVQLKKIITTPDGHDVYEVVDSSSNYMFQYVAFKN